MNDRILSYISDNLSEEDRIKFEHELNSSDELRIEFEKISQKVDSLKFVEEFSTSELYFNNLLQNVPRKFENSYNLRFRNERNRLLAFGLATIITFMFLINYKYDINSYLESNVLPENYNMSVSADSVINDYLYDYYSSTISEGEIEAEIDDDFFVMATEDMEQYIFNNGQEIIPSIEKNTSGEELEAIIKVLSDKKIL